MVEQTREEKREWAVAEVDRLKANLQNLVSLNATAIGIKMAEDELAKAEAALSELEGPEPAAEELTLADEPVAESAEAVSDDPVNQEPEAAATSSELENVADQPEESVTEESAADVSTDDDKDLDPTED